jgi:hypothetical protein
LKTLHLSQSIARLFKKLTISSVNISVIPFVLKYLLQIDYKKGSNRDFNPWSSLGGREYNIKHDTSSTIVIVIVWYFINFARVYIKLAQGWIHQSWIYRLSCIVQRGERLHPQHVKAEKGFTHNMWKHQTEHNQNYAFHTDITPRVSLHIAVLRALLHPCLGL